MISAALALSVFVGACVQGDPSKISWWAVAPCDLEPRLSQVIEERNKLSGNQDDWVYEGLGCEPDFSGVRRTGVALVFVDVNDEGSRSALEWVSPNDLNPGEEFELLGRFCDDTHEIWGRHLEASFMEAIARDLEAVAVRC